MRLSVEEREQIKHIVADVFGADAELRLFGSRVDDSKRGGNVDLYVIPVQQDDLYRKRVRCLFKLESALFYPVDLVVAERGNSRPIDRIAEQTGVVL